MRKAALISAGIFFVILLLAVTAWSSEKNSCVRNIYGKIVCPPQGSTCLIDTDGNIACSPPYGGIVKTLYGKLLCGQGKCMISAFGKAFCSAEQGGSVTIGSSGEPVCTGDCIPASASACSWP